MSGLRIEIDGGRGHEPGETLRGEIHWQGAQAPGRLELRLLWRLHGQAVPEEQGAVRLDWTALDEPAGSRPFELKAPASPSSMRGRFLELDWFLQLSGPDGDPVEQPLELGPAGRAHDWSERDEVEAPSLDSRPLDPDQDFVGPVEVMGTRRGRTFGFVLQMLVIAGVWNGVAWTFALGLPPFEQAAPGWAWLFLLPAVLVGFWWALMLGSGVLTLLGPDPQLILRSSFFVLGASAPLSWEVQPGRRGSRPWQLVLEAREEAMTQLGGTRARAERVFVRAVLKEFDSLREVERGACEIALPSTLPPSFESRRSAIRWLVRFVGAEPRRRWWELTWMDKEFEVSLGGGEGWGDPGDAPPA